MDRKLIYQNNPLLADICGDLIKLKPSLNKLKQAYEALELKEEFNDIIYKELVSKGSSRIAEKYKTELNRQLDKSGITNKNLRMVALSGTEEPLKALGDAITTLKEFKLVPSYASNPRHQVLSVTQITFINDAFIITDEDKESIAEMYCRVYLETDEDHKTYNILLDLQKALAAFEFLKTEKGLPNNTYGMYGQHIHNFFSQSGELQPGSIKWVNGYKAQMEAMHNASMQRQQKEIDHNRAQFQKAGL